MGGALDFFGPRGCGAHARLVVLLVLDIAALDNDINLGILLRLLGAIFALLGLEATMARLDTEAEATFVRPSRIPTAAEARTYLQSLAELWAKTSDAGRHAIAEAVFERIDVLGANDFTFTLRAHAKAHGWASAFGVGDQSIPIGQSGRGERI